MKQLKHISFGLLVLAMAGCASSDVPREDYSSTKDWTDLAGSLDGLTVADGHISGSGTFTSKLITYDTPTQLTSLTFEQIPDWNNWQALPEKIGPKNLFDAPVLVSVGDGDYWLFGRSQAKKDPGPYITSGSGSDQAKLNGYDSWHSTDMKNWVHHGSATPQHARWVTSVEHVDGKFYFYYDAPNDQDPHLIIDSDLRDGKAGEDFGMVWDDPSDGSDAGIMRDLDGSFHLIYEDWSPINAQKHSYDSSLAGHAVSPDGKSPFSFSNFAVDVRTTPTGKYGTYTHPHWTESPRFETGEAKYEIHEPDQDAFGDWTAIRIGDQYYLFGDYEPSDRTKEAEGDPAKIKIGRLTSTSLEEPFELVGFLGKGHPDPTIGFAQGQFYLINQTKKDYVSPGPWVDGVDARAGIDSDGDGEIDQWTGWQRVKETYDHTPGFARVVSKTPAQLDLQSLPPALGFQFEFRLEEPTGAMAAPVIDGVTINAK